MKIKYFLFSLFIFSGTAKIFAQHSININAIVNDADKTIHMEQEVVYRNTSKDTLYEVLFNDWNNSFKSTESPLGKRFSEDFYRRFHFAQEEDRGATVVSSILDSQGDSIFWSRPFMAPDIMRVYLERPIAPGEETSIFLEYDLIIPSDKFTGYGYNNEGDFKIRYWYISPAVYDEEWLAYSNKNLDDQYVPKSSINLSITLPPEFNVITSLNVLPVEQQPTQRSKTVFLSGEDRIDTKLYLIKNDDFEKIVTRDATLLSNIKDVGLNKAMKELTVERIFQFLKERLGEYPHEKLMVTQEEYKANPVYGLNQLPEFIRPFPDGFQYDIKQFKTVSSNYLENTLLINPRKDQWVHDAIHIFLLMEYVDTYYPNMKILGTLSKMYGVRWTHASELEFNDQYPLLYLHMARQNMDQALSTPQDSLTKFNKNIANPYKAGTGFKYLQDYAGRDFVLNSIKDFYTQYALQRVEPEDFKQVLSRNTNKNIEWFFEDYVNSSSKIDFRIKSVNEVNNSLDVTIVNKRDNNMPVSLYGINEGRIVYKTWVGNVNPERTVRIPKEGIERLAVNYELIIPEFNARNNYKGVTTLFNKPVQFRLFKDVEDPRYQQVFFMPDFDYNLYDGAVLGVRVYNNTFLKRNFNYALAPKWGFNSNTLVGSASLSNSFQFENKKLYSISLGVGGSRYSYGYDRFYHTLTPYLSFNFRNSYLRDNERQALRISSVNVYRDVTEDSEIEEPNYNVLSVKHHYRNSTLVKHLSTIADFQLSKGFSKVSFSADYRKLFLNNRQLNLRFFGGAFIYNDKRDNDYFSFALDRPSDYLFEYNYYGRSENSGLFSQQIIMAEGGFKSQLQPEFANQWMTTVNASTNIWKWIYAYGDVGLVKNKDVDAKFLYDSGIRVSFIQDYFELFFPVYSSLGWELGADDYDQRIRFIVTLDLQTLSGLFTRQWY